MLWSICSILNGVGREDKGKVSQNPANSAAAGRRPRLHLPVDTQLDGLAVPASVIGRTLETPIDGIQSTAEVSGQCLLVARRFLLEALHPEEDAGAPGVGRFRGHKVRVFAECGRVAREGLARGPEVVVPAHILTHVVSRGQG